MAKGVSKQEKLKKIQSIFENNPEFFQLKEIEKRASKLGIASQMVKELLQELVDERLVSCEKIGQSNYYWAFSCDFYQKRKLEKESIEKRDQIIKEQNNKLKERIEIARKWKDDPNYNTKVNEMEGLKDIINSLENKLNKIKDFDPETINKKENAIEQLKQGGNLFTESVLILKQYCNDKFFLDEDKFNETFDLPENFEPLP